MLKEKKTTQYLLYLRRTPAKKRIDLYPSQFTSLHQVKQNNRELTRECNEKLAQIESLQNSSNQTLSDEQTKVRDMQVSVRFINFLHPSHIDFLAARWYEQPHKPVNLLSSCSLRFSLIYLSFNFSLVITLVRHSSGSF